MTKREEPTGEQWAILGPLIPKVVPRADGHGRPVTMIFAMRGDLRRVTVSDIANTCEQAEVTYAA